jgi:hypothetical protein
VNVHLPRVRGGDFMYSITHLMQSYSHTIAAYGGFLEATISLSGDQSVIEEWYTDGIGRHIVVVNPAGAVCWEGFVNSIEVVMGAFSATRGPLLNVANRVSAMYTPIIEAETEELVTGTETETTIAEDLVSQQRYGIWEKVINAGTVTDDDAEYIRDTYLEDNREPSVSSDISFGNSGSDANVTLHCRGYIDWLNYAYNDTTDDYVMASTKVAAVVTAEPNSMLTSSVDTNGILVSSLEDGNRMASAIIEEIVSMGDIYDNRWLYGCYENRVVYYNAAPTTVEYFTHLTFPHQVVFLNRSSPIDPWDIRPGKWLELLDFRSYGVSPTDIYENPSTVFIEEVSYTAPNQVQMSGKKIQRVEQLLARLGIG